MGTACECPRPSAYLSLRFKVELEERRSISGFPYNVCEEVMYFVLLVAYLDLDFVFPFFTGALWVLITLSLVRIIDSSLLLLEISDLHDL